MKMLCFLDRLELIDIFGTVSEVIPGEICALLLIFDAPKAATLAALGIANVRAFEWILPEALIAASQGENVE